MLFNRNGKTDARPPVTQNGAPQPGLSPAGYLPVRL